MNNTIILKRGYARLTEQEYKKFNKGDTIFGADRIPEEIKRFTIDQKEEAQKELKNYKCFYNGFTVEEYALEYLELDEDGEFVDGGDYELAEED